MHFAPLVHISLRGSVAERWRQASKSTAASSTTCSSTWTPTTTEWYALFCFGPIGWRPHTRGPRTVQVSRSEFTSVVSKWIANRAERGVQQVRRFDAPYPSLCTRGTR